MTRRLLLSLAVALLLPLSASVSDAASASADAPSGEPSAPAETPDAPAAPADLPSFEWGDTPLDATRMDLIRQYQRRRLWTQDTIPVYKIGRGAKSRWSYAVRGGAKDFWGMEDLLMEVGNKQGLARFRNLESMQSNTAGGLIGIGAGAAGAGFGLLVATGLRSGELTRSIARLPGTDEESRDQRLALIGQKSELQVVTAVGGGLAGAGSLLATVTGLIYWQKRVKATSVWANLRRDEARKVLDDYNRALAEELGLTEEEARLLQIHYGVRAPTPSVTAQVAVGPGGVTVFGTF
ncbi:MAG: hypothetical protein KDA24_12065 [Deltaproteobacteria bacterium]|nr:hypothetical protein [Deltaproteobacteria bacterium]